MSAASHDCHGETVERMDSPRDERATSMTSAMLRSPSSSDARSVSSESELCNGDDFPREPLDAADAVELPAPLVRRLKWRIVPPLWLAYAVAMAERTNISFAELTMGRELGMSEAQFGLAAGIFFVPFALGQVPLVYVAQRVGLVGSLAAMLAVWGVASFLTGFVGSFGQLVALRFVLGLAESAFYATAMAYIAHWLPGKPLGEAVTLFATGGVGGSIIGGPSAGLILTYVTSAAGYAGWRWVFFAQALPGLLLVPLLLCALPSHASSPLSSFLSHAERRAVVAAAAAHRGARKPGSLRSLVGAIGSSAQTWCLSCQMCVTQVMAYMGAFFTPLMAKQFLEALGVAVPLWALGLLALPPLAFSLLLGPRIVRWASASAGRARRFDTMYRLTAGYTCCALGSGVLLLWSARLGEAAAPYIYSFCLLTSLGGVSYFMLFFGLFWSIHAEVTPAALQPVSVAFVNMVGNLGGFMGPVLLGVFHDQLGPFCDGGRTHAGKASCPMQYAWGLTTLALIFATASLCSYRWAIRLGLRGH